MKICLYFDLSGMSCSMSRALPKRRIACRRATSIAAKKRARRGSNAKA